MTSQPKKTKAKGPLDILEMPPMPTSNKGLRTRKTLVKAARRVFEKKGFIDTRLIDITTEAKLSAGTFYTYFDSKEQIFAAVLHEAQNEMLHPGLSHVTDESDSIAVIKASTYAYLETYRRNASLMGLMEQVSHILPKFREFRQHRADLFVERNARSIKQLQKQGHMDSGIDAELASVALSSMVSRMAFSYFVDKQLPGISRKVSMEELVDIATELWANALRINPDKS